MKILVIEDEARILSFLARGLEAEGYSVEGARDGRDGLARAVRRRGISSCSTCSARADGLEVLDALHRQRPELPVLILSARADLPTKLRGFELGASDYVPKPVALDELLARVRVQLREVAPDEDGNLVRGGRLSSTSRGGRRDPRRRSATSPTASSACSTTSCCTRAR